MYVSPFLKKDVEGEAVPGIPALGLSSFAASQRIRFCCVSPSIDLYERDLTWQAPRNNEHGPPQPAGPSTNFLQLLSFATQAAIAEQAPPSSAVSFRVFNKIYVMVLLQTIELLETPQVAWLLVEFQMSKHADNVCSPRYITRCCRKNAV